MKRKYFIIFVMIIIPVLLAGLLTCSHTGGTATVTINLGFAGHESAQNQSFIDRLLGLFLQKAYAQPPVNIESILVQITGPGMSTIEYGFEPTVTTITVVVPAGASRTISVIATASPEQESAALAFTGTATLDLSPGESKSISVTMIVSETKIVIPDYLNNRIIQIDDISGTGSVVYNTISPYDVDFDVAGRIYIARNAAVQGVIRINDITGAGSLDITGIQSIRTLAIDRINNLIYFASSTELRKCNYDGSNPVQLDTTTDSITNMIGLDVDDNGILYIVSMSNTVYKYDPGTQSAVDSYTDNLSSPWDIVIKEPNLYIANPYGANGYRVIQLDSNLSFVHGYGDDATSTNHNPGMFYGPYRFVAILNDKITMIDDGTSPPWNDKLIQMDDINGTNWTTYPTTGDGQAYFRFYVDC